MKFTGICLISGQVSKMREFYMALLGREPSGDQDWWVDFGDVGGAHLSIYNEAGMDEMAAGSMEGSGCGRSTIELVVEDVDAEYERVLATGAEVVKPPTTQTWGRRSAWFRDPDGNIVNLYARVGEEA